MGAVRTHTKQKMGKICPSEKVLVLFRDRMVTNCLMQLAALYTIPADLSIGAQKLSFSGESPLTIRDWKTGGNCYAIGPINQGMIATGNHLYLDSLRGAPPGS